MCGPIYVVPYSFDHFRTTRHHTFVSFVGNNGGGGCDGCGHSYFLIDHVFVSICRVKNIHTVRQSIVQEY